MIRSRFLLAPVLGATASAACGSSTGKLGEVGTYDDGGTFAQGTDDAAASRLAVAIAPAGMTLCKGQCVDLAASATGGVAPYTYVWSGAATGSGATQHVCPSATSTVQVTATDSSVRGGEFASHAALAAATATLTVTADCTPAPDAGPALEAQALCSAQWMGAIPILPSSSNDPFWAFPSLVATDGAGAMIVATNSVTGGNNVYVYTAELRKYDAQCQLVWTKDYVTTASAAGIAIQGLATDASNDVVFVGLLEGNVDLGEGSVGPAAGPAALFLAKLGPDGSGMWNHLVSNASVNYSPESLAIDPSGNVYFASSGLSGVDFGAGPVGLPSETAEAYVAEYTSAGALVTASAVANTGYDFALGSTGAGALVLGTFAQGAVTFTWSGGETTVANEQPIVANFGANQTFAWGVAIPTSVFNPVTMSQGGFSTAVRTRIGAGNDVFFEYTGGGMGPFAGDGGAIADGGAQVIAHGLAKLSPSGTVLWVDDADFAGEAPSPFLRDGTTTVMNLDASENALVADDVTNGANDWDVRIRRIGSSGHVAASETWGGSGPQHALATATDPSGHSVVLGVAGAAPGTAKESMFLVKLPW
jgi:hypothetical protein